MLKFIFFLLLITSLTCKAEKISSMYDSLIKYEVYEPEISLCIIILETKWLSCKGCTLDKNNFFAFLWKGEYKEFRDYRHAILYYKTWQVKWWIPYKKRHPDKDYYGFLKWIGYAPDMDNYVKQLKIIRKNIEFLN